MNAIYHHFIIRAELKKVFDAVSMPKHLVQWWPKTCKGVPARGEEYNFFFEEPYDWYARVSELEKDKFIYFKMTKSDPDWDPTTFGFELVPHEKGTYLKFFHRDWPEANDHMKYSSFCWAMLLDGLRNYVEKGLVVPFEERE
ncbi:SRPBCC family protein [Jiulongibacter sp. NS-SX5]|uniref:SRPBCC family protein n=1 Tax=Jiulongibacter sp. NS-SX5 TaxID=3463854 RepID=UPI00405825D1